MRTSTQNKPLNNLNFNVGHSYLSLAGFADIVHRMHLLNQTTIQARATKGLLNLNIGCFSVTEIKKHKRVAGNYSVQFLHHARCSVGGWAVASCV